jgi:hypothetical protein
MENFKKIGCGMSGWKLAKKKKGKRQEQKMDEPKRALLGLSMAMMAGGTCVW